MPKPERDYSETLYLPQTDFPMRAGLPQREPEILARWEKGDLYGQLRAAAKGRDKFILHDGPPYANGPIHIGTALNKILKDLVTRSQQMLGYDSNYVPGWDCHGLPIEWKIEEENYRAKGKAKPDLSDPAAMIAFRRECRGYAEHWLNVQREEFKRLGVEGDWAHPYTTMAFFAEAQIARELMKFAANGLLYRGSKPVMWSVVEKTALAEAEVEYEDYTSDTVWVKFPVIATQSKFPIMGIGDTSDEAERLRHAWRSASVVIWTTTPWTLPGNRAIAYSDKLKYVLLVPGRQLERPQDLNAAAQAAGVKVDEYEAARHAINEARKAYVEKYGPGSLLVASNLSLSFQASVKFPPSVFDSYGIETALLGEIVCAHPLRGKGYDFEVPLLAGEHVTEDAGTGFVHTAPGHGREDFDVWIDNKATLEARGINTAIPYTVDENGAFTEAAPGFTGKRVINDKGEKGDANEAVIKALIDAGMLIARGRLKHQYPHSWRSKKPVIFRNTPQWFIAMDQPIEGLPPVIPGTAEGRNPESIRRGAGDMDSGLAVARRPGMTGGEGNTLRGRALHAISVTRWVPPQGENRITGMIESRPDWVISRQRAWGVPIAVFIKEKPDGSVDILQDPEVEVRIVEAFEVEGADAWYAPGARERFLGKLANDVWQKVDDILDVWFDSGSTHAFVLEDAAHFPTLAGIKRKRDGGRDTVMYLEGSDQHRGWFQSSLLESCGTRGRAPFDVVVTHGFTLAEDGRKMSKSLGNTIAPQDVIKQSGADILRLWVASCDYWDDQRIGPEILKQTVETYRKLRNTLRWMLGNLAHFHEEERVRHHEQMPELERLMLHRLAELDALVRKAYQDFDYKRIFAALNNFMITELSAFYFDIRKDALYCDPASSMKRKACLTVLDHLFRCTATWLAPILCFTAEEAWMSRNGDAARSVHLELFPEVPSSWRDDALADKWRKVRTVRRVVTGALEIERAQKRIGSSLEAHPIVHVSNAELAEAVLDVDMAEVCITSALTLVEDEGPPNAFRLPDVAGVAVVPNLAEGSKCARSWKVLTNIGEDPQFPDVSPRDAQALREWEGMRKAAE